MIKEYFEPTPNNHPRGGGVKWPSLAERFWNNVDKTADGCWTWKGAKIPRGYGTIGFKNKNILAHRLAYELQYGAIPAGLCVCHHCDNPSCVRGDHLFLGTYKDNEDDKWQKGRGRRGSQFSNSKLTEQQVINIRLERPAASLNALATKYGVSKKLILLIVQRKIWQHI